MLKSTLAKGTIILTIAGLLTRFLGFFYRIWLSDCLGSELLGIYQMIFPISGVCYTIYASGIQTAISKITAEQRSSVSVFFHGLTVSLFLAFLLSFLLYITAPYIAVHFLMEERTAAPLRILSFMFPFGAVSACCNGFYYGKGNSRFPALSQLTEQIVRIVCAYGIAFFFHAINFSCELAVFVLVLGEAISALLSISSLFLSEMRGRKLHTNVLHKSTFRQISVLALPLGTHRLIINLLHSFEATLIPFTLVKSGLTKAFAVSTYGIINGMVFPFIFFPNALTGSLSVLLLPAVSKATHQKNTVYLKKIISLSLAFSLLLGIFFTLVFFCLGDFLGTAIFHEPRVGIYLRILAWLCPFLYISSTLSSILNGLNKIGSTFCISILSIMIKLVILMVFVPRFGMPAYFVSLLASQIFTTVAEFFLLLRTHSFHK